MKRLLIPFFALALCPPSVAAPIHLTCSAPSGDQYAITVNEAAGTVHAFAVGAADDTPWQATQVSITASRINFVGLSGWPMEVDRQTGVLSIDVRPYGEVINDYRCSRSQAPAKRLF